jgi:hypothetical protein
MTPRPLLGACVLAAAAAAGTALLVTNALTVRSGRPMAEVLPLTYRYWEDVRAAAASAGGSVETAAVPASGDAFTQAVVTEAERRGIGITSFWRSIPLDALPPPATDRITALEDVGRARILAVFFRALGGVAPFLLLWVPALLAVPALAALTGSFAAMGRPLAGIILAVLAGASAFVADALFLSYSPVGFYVVALFVLAAVSAYAAGPGLRREGAREVVITVLAGLALALCAACRGGVLLLLPGFVAAAVVAAIRWRAPGRAAALAALLILPSLLLRPSESHNLWISVWEGLGDFDRERGHSWSDAAAKRALRAAGVDDLRGPDAEPTMRGLVLADVRADPRWYAKILARRVKATVLQDKIAPGGHALAAPNGPGEGAMDGYYGLTRHADTFAVGRVSVELPAWMLWAPLALLIVLRPRDALVLLPLAIGALAVPVLISTAGAFETQAFVLVHLAAAALLVDAAARRIRRPDALPSPSVPPAGDSASATRA